MFPIHVWNRCYLVAYQMHSFRHLIVIRYAQLKTRHLTQTCKPLSFVRCVNITWPTVNRSVWEQLLKLKMSKHLQDMNEALSVWCHHVWIKYIQYSKVRCGVWIKYIQAHLGCEFSSYMRSLPSLNKLIVCFVFFVKFSMKTRKYSLSPSVSILPS